MSCYKSSSELVNVVFHRWLNSAHIPLRIWETALKNYNNKINMNIDAQHICWSFCPDYYSIGGRLCTFSMPLSLSFLSLCSSDWNRMHCATDDTIAQQLHTYQAMQIILSLFSFLFSILFFLIFSLFSIFFLRWRNFVAVAPLRPQIQMIYANIY